MEYRIYLINTHDYQDLIEDSSSAFNPQELSDEEFIAMSEELGTIYSLKGFQDSINNGLYGVFNSVCRVLPYKIKGVDQIEFLSIPKNETPEDVLQWFEKWEPYTYMDTNDLREHLYSYDFLDTTNLEPPLEVVSWVQDYLDPLLQHNSNLAYFRFQQS